MLSEYERKLYADLKNEQISKRCIIFLDGTSMPWPHKYNNVDGHMVASSTGEWVKTEDMEQVLTRLLKDVRNLLEETLEEE